jgi:hypothetical protein
MTREDELLAFIEAAKAQGATDEFLAALLRSQGWSSNIVYAAFARYYEARTGTAVPVRQGIVEGARDAFLHLLSFGTLAAWTVALGSLLFDFINSKFPDPVVSGVMFRQPDGLASSLASMLVSFPVYVLVMRFILADQERYPEKRESSIHKWLTWLALLIAASVILGDLVTFLNYFLRGEITARFVLKVVVVLAIAGGVFSYYMASMRPAREERTRIWAGAAVVGVSLALIAGFSMLGSPDRQRLLQADSRRVEDLQAIHRVLHARSATAPLPEALTEPPLRRTDPVTGNAYYYQRHDEHRYQLCATFSFESEGVSRDLVWYHPAGRHCYTFDHRHLP